MRFTNMSFFDKHSQASSIFIVVNLELKVFSIVRAVARKPSQRLCCPARGARRLRTHIHDWARKWKSSAVTPATTNYS